MFEEKERALVTLNLIGDAVISTDKNGNVNFMNPVAEKLLGKKMADVAHCNLDSIVCIIRRQTRTPIEYSITRTLRENRTISSDGDVVLVKTNGDEVAIESSAAPIHDRNGRVIGGVMVFRDISLNRELVWKAQWQATHDALTGLMNRAEFEKQLNILVEKAKQGDCPHVLLYFDLDQLKAVNDSCGHAAGDELLCQLTLLLSELLPSDTVFARLGGDEFGVLLESCSHQSSWHVANLLRRTIKNFRFVWQEKPFEIGVSIGMVMIASEKESGSSFLSAADSACYIAKDLGRNRIHLHQPDDRELLRRQGELRWLSKLTDALAENRFVLHSQKILPINSAINDSRHLEVLLRLRRNDGDLISPASFIPAAERYDLMPEIDRWVIKNTLASIGRYLNTDDLNALQTVSINLSGNSFRDDSFLEFIYRELARSNIDAKMICFEITETSAISNFSKAICFIHGLKQRGCRFALDDFGSGVSSFGYLKNLPVDYLKIDGGFVRDIANNAIDYAMVEAINQIGHVMNIQTVAEFVEDEPSMMCVRSIGIDYAQGFGIQAPIPLEQALGIEIK